MFCAKDGWQKTVPVDNLYLDRPGRRQAAGCHGSRLILPILPPHSAAIVELYKKRLQSLRRAVAEEVQTRIANYVGNTFASRPRVNPHSARRCGRVEKPAFEIFHASRPHKRRIDI
jgi:hypothetical protein